MLRSGAQRCLQQLNYSSSVLAKAFSNSATSSSSSSLLPSLKRVSSVSLNMMSCQSVRLPQSSFATFSNNIALSQPQRPAPHPSEGFLSGSSAIYVDETYHAWKNDPSSVHKSWDIYFRAVEKGLQPGLAYVPPPTIQSSQSSTPIVPQAGGVGEQELLDHLKVVSLIRAHQVSGHRIANLDPLGIFDADLDGSIPPELEPSSYNFSASDLNREFTLRSSFLSGFMGADKPMKLGTLLAKLKETYCGNIGYEYMHIQNRDQCNWLRERIERTEPEKLDHEEKKRIFNHLVRADGFERYLANKFRNDKRFGLEGAESLIPGILALLETASEGGVECAVLGMPHRGRLNVLSNIVGKSQEAIFSEFAHVSSPRDETAGDVKYHLGLSKNTVIEKTQKPMHISLVANPSHLEAVNPVVQGKVRAEQFYRGDKSRTKVLPILLHGDAAFAGQGVVFETFGLSDLPNYTTGGTVHLVINNQIGFTTDPRFARSSPYCTEVAKVVGAPIFHVNGDDVEAVVSVCRLAMQFRQKFSKDVVVDIVCYRRHGHNEVDQPSFTQPRMYQVIGKHTPTLELYSKKLVEEGAVTQEYVNIAVEAYKKRCEEAFDRSKEHKSEKRDWLESYWKGFKGPEQMAKIQNTGVDIATLKELGRLASSYPSDFKVHDMIRKILGQRVEALEKGADVDWALGETLAFATLLADKNHVRLSGQDVERGTFSHRHHVLHDQARDGVTYVPLNKIAGNQAEYTVCNSSLSEYGVMGFELGYSMTHPNSLVLWEAQFGDFANTAQVIIDQFLSAGESKWNRQCGLVLLLPHGYEGNGAEHSSARLERFLQLCDDDADVFPVMSHEERMQIQKANLQVVNCSTPANYYHVLRRQIYREFRKPLVVMTPKYLLRHRLAKSSLEEMKQGTRFRRLINETTIAPSGDVRRLIFCSGKIYYDLFEAREKREIKNVALARVEQISPFPFDLVKRQAADFPNAEIYWVQEEPKNAGAWTYVQPRIETALSHSTTHAGARPKYIGRAPCAATATGKKEKHEMEEKDLINRALTV